VISFQIDNLEAFAIEFDVYATFGARVIARAVASSKVFTSQKASSGQWYLELLDPRLRAVGRLSFSFLVVKPFTGIPLEISHFATYWKATAQQSSAPIVTGSSLSGHYVRLFVQVTCDGIAVLYPQWTVSHHGLDVPILRLTGAQFQSIGADKAERREAQTALDRIFANARTTQVPEANLPLIHRYLASSYETVAKALASLPPTVNVELHVLYPTPEEEAERRLGPTPTINQYADALLGVVFEHARQTRDKGDGWIRSVVFSSYNAEICIALNWKQPNCRFGIFGIQQRANRFRPSTILQ
jgi:CDK inhibitor PHO81